MQGLIGRLGSNFIVAAFIPSLWFVVFAQIIFSPFDPAGKNSIFALHWNIFAGEGLITLILTLLIGYTLMGLNTFIYKLLEGYSILERIPILNGRQQRKAKKRQNAYRRLDHLADQLNVRSENEESEDKQESLNAIAALIRKQSQDLKAQYKLDYPTQTSRVLPTRFGNVLKSFELYSLENYGIDSVTIWPRLIYVMDPSYYKKVDQSNNGLAFIVNCMVLSLVLALMCIITSIYQYYNVYKGYTIRGAKWELFLVAALLMIGLVVIFYNASLPAAKRYGNMVRSSFDLVRFSLLEQLRMPMPEDNKEELITWWKLSKFFALGDLNTEEFDIPYSYSKGQHQAGQATGSISDHSSESDDDFAI